jgi:fructose/tagatose bisphosphate aldolase
LLRVANVLGIRRAKALVAATFGQVHGRYARGGVHLGLEVLGDHQAPLMDA